MLRTKSWLMMGGAALIACFATTTCWADLAMPGGYQSAGGYGTDWTPSNAPLLNDLGGGLWDLPLAGLAASTRYNFKILDDEGSPPANWGDPEHPNNGPGAQDNWFLSGAGGAATIMLDTNTYNDGFYPATDRIVFSTDATAFATFYATGNWMSEAGGVDWINNNPTYAMIDQGGGLYAVNAVISVPGSYMYKSTAGDWNYQWGSNGRLNDSANLSFDTTAPNQPVTFLLDISKGAISVTIPEPATALLLGLGGLMALAICRRR